MVLLMTIMAVGVFLVWLWRREKHPVDLLPGPRKLPLFGNILMFVGSRDVAFERFNEVARQYQPLYRTWLANIPVVHLMHPKYIEIVLKSSQHISKSRDYDLLKDWLGTGLLTSGGSKWHSRRKLLTPAFHFSILEQFIPVFSDKSRILISKLQEYVGKEEGVDIVHFITRCTLDVVCETAMGTELNAQEDTESQYVSAIYEINSLIVSRLVRPWLYSNWLYSLTPSGRKHKQSIKLLHEFTNKVIKERRAELSNSKNIIIKEDLNQNNDHVIGMKKRTAFLDLLIQMSDADPELTDEEIRQEVDTFMFEGHDTTAMAISWALYFIGCNPEIQSLCVAEMNRIFEGTDRAASLTDLNSMKYLERVIKETLRLRPSVFLINRKVDTTLVIDEYEFPADTKVQIHIFNIHRNPEIYPEPEKFDPDRFLPENCVGRHPYAYIPFSAGPRNCIGQKFAMLEMKSTLSSILRNFKFETRDPDLCAQYLPDLLLRPKNGIVLGLNARKM